MQYSMPSLIIIGCARTNIKKHLVEWTLRRASRPRERRLLSAGLARGSIVQRDAYDRLVMARVVADRLALRDVP